MGAGLMNPNKMNSSSSLNGKNTAEIDIFAKTMPAILNLNWGAWENLWSTRLSSGGNVGT